MKKFIFAKKKWTFVLLFIIIFFIGKYYFIDSKKTASDFAVAQKGDIKEELALSGEIDSYDHAVLSFGIAGKVGWVGVKEGDWINKGQTIATLEKEKLEAVLRQAWQDFTAAKAASDKYYDGRTGDSESYDQKIERTALDAAQNKAYDNIRIAQENLKGAALYSPIDGLVVNTDPSLAGVNVSALSSSYEIVNPSTVFLKVIADQTEVGSIREGETGEIIFDSYPDQKIKGIVEDISFVPTKDETGTVYDVKVSIPDINNTNYKYKLGMTADMNFVTKEKKNVLIIPLQYVNSDNNGKFVLVGKDKKKTYIKTGLEDEQNTEVTGGLSEGDRVSL